MAARRTILAPRPSPALQALLGLSGLLARAKQGGVFSEALALVFEGSGVQRGAVYEASAEGLTLVAEEGLPKALAAFVRVFGPTETPWFPVQNAAKKRRVVVENEVALAAASRIDAALVDTAGWSAVAAAPIMVGRDVLGVLVIAAPSADAFSPDTLAVLETAANVLALSIARDQASALAKPETPLDERRAPAETKLARLAILGSLAAGFADEIRWPLSSLGTQLVEQERLIGDLKTRYPGVGGAFADLARIQEEATTALTFARTAGSRLLSAIEDGPAQPVDLSELAHEATALVEPTARARQVDLLVTSIDDGKPIVIGKRSDLGQLLLALLTNSVDACASVAKPPGKDGKESEKPLVCVTVAREGNKIVLCVEDAGPGIPPDVKPRIFEPFFSTKKEGVGLGLTLARQVVVAHNGSIELERSELGGALLRVVLPAAPVGTVIARDHAPPSRRKPIPPPQPEPAPGPKPERLMPSEPTEESPPHTVRDGWTSAPSPIKQPSKRPVRAPQPLPGSQRVGRDADVCAPTQRVPRTPATGSPVVQMPKPVMISSPAATPIPGSVEPVTTPMMETWLRTKVASTDVASSGRAAPTARVPEAPRRGPKSRRGR